MNNLSSYNSLKAVGIYLGKNNLQKPEQVIKDKLLDKLFQMKMLDIGVGCGRTSFHFAELVKEYVGIDYAANMIKECQRNFGGKKSTITFRVMDVRKMDSLESNYFDFILFSYNGLDYISHEERIIALKEIKRVSKKGAFLFFSSHNLNSIQSLYKLKLAPNPLITLNRIRKLLTFLIINGSRKKFRELPYAIINDGAHSFKLKTYYILPSKQVEQLIKVEFRNIQTFSILSGLEIDLNEIDKSNESWIYYLCKS